MLKIFFIKKTLQNGTIVFAQMDCESYDANLKNESLDLLKESYDIVFLIYFLKGRLSFLLTAGMIVSTLDIASVPAMLEKENCADENLTDFEVEAYKENFLYMYECGWPGFYKKK